MFCYYWFSHGINLFVFFLYIPGELYIFYLLILFSILSSTYGISNVAFNSVIVFSWFFATLLPSPFVSYFNFSPKSSLSFWYTLDEAEHVFLVPIWILKIDHFQWHVLLNSYNIPIFLFCSFVAAAAIIVLAVYSVDSSCFFPVYLLVSEKNYLDSSSASWKCRQFTMSMLISHFGTCGSFL